MFDIELDAEDVEAITLLNRDERTGPRTPSLWCASTTTLSAAQVTAQVAA